MPNLFFTLTTIIVNFALASLLYWSSSWVVAHNFGIINWLFPDTQPLWLYAFLFCSFLRCSRCCSRSCCFLCSLAFRRLFFQTSAALSDPTSFSNALYSRSSIISLCLPLNSCFNACILLRWNLLSSARCNFLWVFMRRRCRC